MMELLHSKDAIPSVRPPPVEATSLSSASSTSLRRRSGQQTLWQRLRSLVWAREDFIDFDTESLNKSLPDVTEMQRRVVRLLDTLYLPNWLKCAFFHLSDFLTRRRVHLVLLLTLILLVVLVPKEAVDDVTGSFTVDETSRPGLTFFARYNGNSRVLPRKRPVVIIPGFITGALEVWETSLPCLQRQSSVSSSFRQRMFGPSMIYLILTDPQCWLDAFRLDPKTGGDPSNAKIRADSGFTSVDYFVPGYWVWAKVLINLADIGYDPQSMAVMTYDWRLSPQKAHERDGLFYLIRNNLKFLVQKNRQRAVVISHSYGTTVALSFFRWAEEREAGFMDRYVAYYVNVGGVSMGLPKAVSGALLGDAKDTVDIPRPARHMLDSFIRQDVRYNFTRTWSCLLAMLPSGCEEAWSGLLRLPNGTSLGMRGTAALMREECKRTGHEDCVRHTDRHLEQIDELPSLPQAPRTTVACLYGVNLPSESGYHLSDHPSGVGYVSNFSLSGPHTSNGVELDDGDSTVPLMSLAYMCRALNGWRRNVGRVVTMEYYDNGSTESPLRLRGGTISGKHVDILGNYDMLETILKIVSGVDEQGEDPAMDEFEYTNPRTGEVSQLTRRVRDRIFTNVDFRIRGELRSCLKKKNKPITSLENVEEALHFD